MDSPANMPSARQFVKNYYHIMAYGVNLKKRMNLPLLRYKRVVEWIQRFFEPQLTFMNDFEEVNHPNLTPLFLANAIIHHHYVITTNFDYFIEFALGDRLPAKNSYQNAIRNLEEVGDGANSQKLKEYVQKTLGTLI